MVKMSSLKLSVFSTAPKLPLKQDDSRRAPWLLSPYSAEIWSVTDSNDRRAVESINFDFRLADGRSLTTAESLYKTVKEFAFFARDSRFSVIDDAKTHVTAVRNLMHLAHALSLNNIWSFAHLQPFDLECIVEDCRYGADAVIHAAERLELYLESSKRSGLPYAGLPRSTNKTNGKFTKSVDSAELMRLCNLPASASMSPCVATITAKAALSVGLRPNSGITERDEIRPIKNVTAQSLLRWLMPIEQLHEMRRSIVADSVGFKPFPYGASKVANAKGGGTERTPTPPPALALELFSRAAKTVYSFNSANCESLDHAAKRRIFIACWIIVAAFSARRREEIDDLRHGCIRGDSSSGYWLHIYIEKTLQRKEWIPVPEVVARAVETLTTLSAQARELTTTDHLFQHRDGEGVIRTINAGKYLDDFSTFVGVPMHQPKGKTAESWHWHPHQFRRFFAILYFYRFEGATIEVLAHFLRHFNLEMTKRYVTQDPEVAAIWTDVEWGYMGHVARGIVAGERSVGGAAGNRLKKLAIRLTDVLRQKVQVVDPDRVGASLTLLMQRKGLVLTPKPWVTCSCPSTPTAARKAACRNTPLGKSTSGVGPSFAHAGPTICPGCPHAIAEASQSNFVDREIDHLSTVLTTGHRTKTVFGALEAIRLVELREARNTHYGGGSSTSSQISD